MNFLFLLPRLHNNQYELMRVLRAHYHEVQVGVLYALPTERYDLVSPATLGYSRIFQGIKRLFHRASTSALKDRFELRYGFPPVWKLWKLMRTSQAEVVVIKNIDSTFSFLSLCFARLLGKKIIVTLQIEKYRKQPKSGSVAFVARFFRAQVITPLLGDCTYPNENTNLHYIPFTHALDEHMEDRRDRSGVVRILCVAKFQARKNQLLLLDALQTAQEQISYTLRLIGQRGEPDYLEVVQRTIQERGLNDRVSIEFDLPWSDMQKAYRWADLYILPSAREPASVSLLEAMSFGLPVICSDQNGTKGYVVEGENGSVFRSGDLNDLVRAIRQIATDRARLLAMGERSQMLVRERHAPEVTYEQFMQVISG